MLNLSNSSSDFVSEKDMYPLIMEYLRKHGYIPVLGEGELSIPIGDKIFYPDVSGKRGVEVCAVEAKNAMDDKNVIEAFVQAEMYQKGCTHVYIAFPKQLFEGCDQKFQNAILERCKKEGLGLLIVSKNDTTAIISPTPSTKIDYEILGKIHETFESYMRSDVQEIYNTLPELVKDVCILLSAPKSRQQFETELKEDKRINWTKKSGARLINPDDAVRNRIRSTIESAKVLGLISENDGVLSRTVSGEYFVAGLGEDHVGKPLPLHCKTFLQAILLRSSTIAQAVQTLLKEKEMYFDYIVCENCWYKEWIGWPRKKENLLCPKCKSPMKTCLTYEVQASYYPLKFAEELEIFKFQTAKKPRIRRVSLPIG